MGASRGANRLNFVKNRGENRTKVEAFRASPDETRRESLQARRKEKKITSKLKGEKAKRR